MKRVIGMKKRVAMLLAMLMLLLLSACAESPSGADALPGAPDANSEVSVKAQGEAAAGGALVYSGWFGYYGVGTAEGYYMLKNNYSTNTENITYIDYATRKHVYLCSSLNCTHEDDSCPSFVPFNGAMRSLMVVGDKLVLVYDGNSYYFDELGDLAYPHIDVMDKNGANRKTIAQFKDEEFLSTEFLADDSKLYFQKQISREQEDGAYYSEAQLMSLDIYTGATEELFAFEDGDYILGAVGSEVLFVSQTNAEVSQTAEEEIQTRMREMEESPESYTDDDWEKIYREWDALYQEAWDKSKYELKAFSVAGGGVRKVHAWARADIVNDWCNGRDGMYYVTKQDGALKRVDFQTGEVQTVCEDMPDLAEKNAYYQGAYGEWIFLDYTVEESETRYVQGRFAVNVQSGEVKEVGLRPEVVHLATLLPMTGSIKPLWDDEDTVWQQPQAVMTSGGWEDSPVPVITEVQDKLLVVKKYELKTEMMSGKMGEMYPVEMESPCYALIEKADYVNGNAEYLDIEFIQ